MDEIPDILSELQNSAVCKSIMAKQESKNKPLLNRINSNTKPFQPEIDDKT